MTVQNIFFTLTGFLLALVAVGFFYHRIVVKGKNAAITRQLIACSRLKQEIERLHTEKDVMEKLLNDMINKNDIK